MFATLRRHRTWVLVLIIAVMIIPLLYWANPSTRMRGGGAGGGQGPEINGKLVTQTMLNNAAREVKLLYFLNFRKWPEDDVERAQQVGFDIDTEAYLRLFRVSKAEEAGVHVADQTVADLARRLLGDYPLDRFAKDVLEPRGLTADDFERFVRNDAAIQQLGNIIGAAGRLITPQEAETLFRRDHQEMSADIVFFSLSNYLS